MAAHARLGCNSGMIDPRRPQGLDVAGVISRDRSLRGVLGLVIASAFVLVLAAVGQSGGSSACAGYDTLLYAGILVTVVGVVLGVFRLFRAMMVVVAIGVVLIAVALGNLSGLGCGLP